MSSFNNLVGQISPQFDDMWVIQRDISDEFNEEKLLTLLKENNYGNC